MSDELNFKRQSFFDTIVRRPVAVTMVVLTFVVFGITSLRDLPLALMPDLSYPSLTIRTAYPSADPSSVERRVTTKIEERVGGVAGLTGLSSVSRAEMSEVTLQFEWGTDMIRATASVSEMLERMTLAPEIERPQVLRYDPAQDPIIRLMLFGPEDMELAELRSYTEDVLKPELSKLSGVAAVNTIGGVERQVRIYPDEGKLAQYGLSIGQLAQHVRAANVDESAGLIVSGGREVLLRVENLYDTKQVVEALEIPVQGGGRVRLDEIASVEISNQDPDSITRYRSAGKDSTSNREGVLLEILKEGDANILDAAAVIRERLYGDFITHIEEGSSYPSRAERDKQFKNLSKDEKKGFDRDINFGLLDRLPKGYELTLLTDESRFIESAVAEVQDAVIFGGILAVFVIFLFLSTLRSTVLVGLAIPLSVITTFIPMRMAGLNLNLMSLGGLALGVGMLVDNSIVVLESIARCREEGDSLRDAAARGAKEVGGAILASTITSVCVFFPIVFVEGVAGQVFVPMALTVVFSLLASLIVALLVVPAYAAIAKPEQTSSTLEEEHKAWKHFLKQARLPENFASRPWLWPFQLIHSLLMLTAALVIAILGLTVIALAWCLQKIASASKALARLSLLPLTRTWNTLWQLVATLYPKLLDRALRRPALTLLLTFGLSLLGVLVGSTLSMELLPSMNERELYVDVAAADGTPLEITDREAMLTAAQAIPNLEGVIDGVMTESGGGIEVVSRPVGAHRARFVVTLTQPTPEAVDAVKREFATAVQHNPVYADAPEFRVPTLFSTQSPVSIEVRGQDISRLISIAETIAENLKRLRAPKGGTLVQDVRTSAERGRPQIRLIYDREKLARFGLNSESVTRELKLKIGGDVISDFEYRGEKIDLFINLEEADRTSLFELGDIQIAPGRRLRDVLRDDSTLDVSEAPSEILRVGNERVVAVTASPSPGVALGLVRQEISHLLSEHDYSLPDTRIVLGGQQQELERSSQSLILALALAVFLVYAVMATQFESFIDPLLIMGTIPLAAVGVLYALWAGDMAVSVVVMLGLIVLAGIVVNNAIVLIDYAKTLRSRGMDVGEAIRQSAAIRLRPIMITTLTTVLGLLPMTGLLHPLFAPLANLTSDLPVLGDIVGFIAGGEEGSEMRAPLAITVVVGLISSTLLTLIVIPTLYSVVHTRSKKA